MCELQDALRSGDVWVMGSRQFKDFEEYLLPQTVFEQQLADGTVEPPVPLARGPTWTNAWMCCASCSTKSTSRPRLASCLTCRSTTEA